MAKKKRAKVSASLHPKKKCYGFERAKGADSFRAPFNFDYTTPSARSSALKCKTQKVTRGGKTISKNIDPRPECAAAHADKPCSSARSTCPVQFVFIKGAPTLRFCVRAGDKEPGHLVPVKSPKQAREIAEKICENWSRRGGTYESKDVEGFAMGKLIRGLKGKRK